MRIDQRPMWMNFLIRYLIDAELSLDKNEVRRLKNRVTRCTLYDGLLYQMGQSLPLLHCVYEEEAVKILMEIHEGICRNHNRGQSLVLKVLKQGYYWSTLKKDAFEYSKRCDKCQRYTIIPRVPPENLTIIVSPWPFAKWGINIIGPFYKTLEGYKFTIVAIDHCTKWVEVEPLTSIT